MMKPKCIFFLILVLFILFHYNYSTNDDSYKKYNKNNIHNLASYIVRDNLWKNDLNLNLIHKFWCLEHLAICHFEKLLSLNFDSNFVNKNKTNICYINSYCYQTIIYPKCDFDRIEHYLYLQSFQDIQEEYCSHIIGLKHGFRIQKTKLEKRNIFIPTHNFDQIQIPNVYPFDCDQKVSITLEYYFIIKEFFESENK